MRILVTGASGLVGQHVIQALEGHEVLAAGRTPPKVQASATSVTWPGEALPDVDAVIHLAGASIGGRRWNRRYQQEIRASRIETTRALVARYGSDVNLVCANAVGYYGRDPEGPCTIDRGPGDDFLARVCIDWQAAAQAHPGPTAVVRFGHVLAPGQGILGRLERLHKLRAAGIIPPGDQRLPWIEAHDLAQQLAHAATTGVAGVFHANVGNVTAGDLHRALCARIGGFPRVRVPAAALRLRLGRFAPYLMGGQEVLPAVVPGVKPQWTDLDAYLDHVYS